MKLSRSIAYAVHATRLLSEFQPGKTVTCRELAARGHMPERFLLQILRNLVTHGVLRSTRGVKGGYTLLKVPEKISLLEIVESVDGPVTFDLTGRDGDLGSLGVTLHQLEEGVREKLSSLKLSDLGPLVAEFAPTVAPYMDPEYCLEAEAVPSI
jgi:Rrf2 family protein